MPPAPPSSPVSSCPSPPLDQIVVKRAITLPKAPISTLQSSTAYTGTLSKIYSPNVSIEQGGLFSFGENSQVDCTQKKVQESSETNIARSMQADAHATRARSPANAMRLPASACTFRPIAPRAAPRVDHPASERDSSNTPPETSNEVQNVVGQILIDDVQENANLEQFVSLNKRFLDAKVESVLENPERYELTLAFCGAKTISRRNTQSLLLK